MWNTPVPVQMVMWHCHPTYKCNVWHLPTVAYVNGSLVTWPCLCEIYKQRKINDQMTFHHLMWCVKWVHLFESLNIVNCVNFACSLIISICIFVLEGPRMGQKSVSSVSSFALLTCILHITQHHSCFFHRDLTSSSVPNQPSIIHTNLLGKWPLTIIARLLIWNLSLA